MYAATKLKSAQVRFVKKKVSNCMIQMHTCHCCTVVIFALPERGHYVVDKVQVFHLIKCLLSFGNRSDKLPLGLYVLVLCIVIIMCMYVLDKWTPSWTLSEQLLESKLDLERSAKRLWVWWE